MVWAISSRTLRFSMNYRHSYHAGSFVDVFKHVVLIALLQSLQRKETPFCYIDTHAGIGCYDLHSKEAKKTQEYATGIARIISQNIKVPSEVQSYLAAVQSVNPTESGEGDIPRFYPGSPRIGRYFLRAQDKMVLSELHPQDVFTLKQEFYGDKQVAVHEVDGYLGLKAFVPPKEKRGLVLIDPPFEQEDEVEQIYRALKMALQRWPTGIYAVWYPLKEMRFIHNLQRKLRSLKIKKMLVAELSIYPEDSPLSLNGSGMVIINPPWQLDEQLNILLPWVWRALSPEKKGGFRVTFVDGSLANTA